MEALYSTELTDMPEDIMQAIAISVYDVSRCRFSYPKIRPMLDMFGKRPSVDYDID